jgi:hypothetical protein
LRRASPLPSVRRKSKGHERKPSVDKAFLELGRRHFAHDFPNPTRKGCPQDDVLRLLAEQPTKVGDSVLDHITLCSPCYTTYSGFLQQMKAKHSNRRSQTQSPKPPRV